MTARDLQAGDAREGRWRRRALEWGFWLAFAGLFWTLGAFVMARDYAAAGRHVPLLQMVTNEASSAIAALALIPLVGWWLTRFPLERGKWAHSLAGHLLGAVLFSIAHVLGMMALRSLTYALLGRVYDHATGEGMGGLVAMFAYEFSKDLPLYAAIVLIIWLYRRWRSGRSQQVARAPTHLLADRGQRQVRLPVREVEWLKSAGNYVSLMKAGDEYLVRGTMTRLSKTLAAAGFVRVHRGYTVNLEHVQGLKPLDGGAVHVVMKDGTPIPLGRTYKPGLMQHLDPD